MVQFASHTGPRLSCNDLVLLHSRSDAIHSRLFDALKLLRSHIAKCSVCVSVSSVAAHARVCCAGVHCKHRSETEGHAQSASKPQQQRTLHSISDDNSNDDNDDTDDNDDDNNDDDGGGTSKSADQSDRSAHGRVAYTANLSALEVSGIAPLTSEPSQPSDQSNHGSLQPGHGQNHRAVAAAVAAETETEASATSVADGNGCGGGEDLCEFLDVNKDSLRLCRSCLRYGHRACVRASSGKCLQCTSLQTPRHRGQHQRGGSASFNGQDARAVRSDRWRRDTEAHEDDASSSTSTSLSPQPGRHHHHRHRGSATAATSANEPLETSSLLNFMIPNHFS